MPFGLSIKFSVGGKEDSGGVMRELGLAFERAGLNVTQFDKYVWPRLTDALESIEKDQFQLEGAGPVAGAWAPLTERYAKEKAKKYPGAPINVRRGHLRDAFTNSGSGYAMRAESQSQMVFGSQEVPYASYAQDGTRRMVPRPVLDLGEEFQDVAAREVEKGVREAMRDADPQNLAGFPT